MSYNIYITARIENKQKLWIKELVRLCREGGHFVLVPWEAVNNRSALRHDMDLIMDNLKKAIEKCDYFIVAGDLDPEITSEVGYASGLNKPVIRYTDGDDPWFFLISRYVDRKITTFQQLIEFLTSLRGRK